MFTEDELIDVFRQNLQSDSTEAHADFNRIIAGYSRKQLLAVLQSTRSDQQLTKSESTMKQQSIVKRIHHRLHASSRISKAFLETEIGYELFEKYKNLYEPITIGEGDNAVIGYKKKDIASVDYTPKHFINGRAVEYTLKFFAGHFSYVRVPIPELTTYSVTPTLHWTVKGDERTIHTDHELLSDFMPHLREVLPEQWNERSFDSLLGLIAIAFFSRGITNTWPKKMSLPRARNTQPMGPAQIPVLAHMKKRDLEKDAKLLPAMEVRVEEQKAM